MLAFHTDRIISRLNQLLDEIQGACDIGLDYHDRLREFKNFCEDTPTLAQFIKQLPSTSYDLTANRREIPNNWKSGNDGYAMRWSAIIQMVEGGPDEVDNVWCHLSVSTQYEGLSKITNLFVIPIYHFLINHLQLSSAMIYLLLRYKRWAEWFEAIHLQKLYTENSTKGEEILDESLRRFLFESGIDYPFSQPASPHGKADVVANLETDDPLVLEIKIWDSRKNYTENRLRDGLRQVIDYATKYGEDSGYVVIFNLDEEPLSFSNHLNKNNWPPFIEYGGKTYYFIDIHIAERSKPISQLDKGKRVLTHNIELTDLLKNELDS